VLTRKKATPLVQAVARALLDSVVTAR
jgi:hypothetical protein